MKRTVFAFIAIGLFTQPSVVAQTVESAIGLIETELGTPTPKAAQTLYDTMDRGNAVTAFVWGMPAVGIAGFFHEWKEVFDAEYGQFVAHVTVQDKRGYHTANNVASYVGAVADLQETGPLVFEDPPGNTSGAFFDLWQRAFGVCGLAGPFKGKGGKFLILGPGQEDPELEGSVVVRSPTHHMFFGTRLLDLDVGKAVREVAPLMKAYPLREATNPPKRPLIMGNNRKWGEQPPRGFEYFIRLAEILRNEPVAERDRFIMAMLKPLGIQAGKPFAPTKRQRRILTEAAEIGYRTLRAAVDQRRNTPPSTWGRFSRDRRCRRKGVHHAVHDRCPRRRNATSPVRHPCVVF